MLIKLTQISHQSPCLGGRLNDANILKEKYTQFHLTVKMKD